MKITPENETVIQKTIEQEQKKHIQLNTSRVKTPGLTLWEYNFSTKKLRPAEFVKEPINIVDIHNMAHTRWKVIQDQNCMYFQKLNRKNAIRHLKKYNLTVEHEKTL